MLPGLLKAVGFSLACIGTAYYALSTCALLRHFRTYKYKNAYGGTLSVSLLKPVAGLDAGARENFEFHLHQDYPDYEVLFGILDQDDSATPLLESIAASVECASFFVGSDIDGSNNKVRILHNLARRASGEILVITDADTRVSPDFLRRITAPFSDPEVGVVTCLYKGIQPGTLHDALESLHMTTIWSPSVASAEALGGISFGLGAAVAIRAETLRRIGGFESIVDYLADDFHLGRKAYRLGWDVVLSDYVVDIALSGGALRDLLTREVRWARTTRASSPAGYIGYGVTFGFAWALVHWLLSGMSLAGLGLLAGVIGVRAVSACICAAAVGDKGFRRKLLLLPVRDALSFITWVSGFLSHNIEWRGRRLKLLRNGTMVAVKKSASNQTP